VEEACFSLSAFSFIRNLFRGVKRIHFSGNFAENKALLGERQPAQKILRRIEPSLIGSGEQAYWPVGAEHQSGGAERFERGIGVRA